MKTLTIDCTLDYDIKQPTELIFQLQSSVHPWQQCSAEKLHITPSVAVEYFERPNAVNRLFRVSVPEGKLNLSYQATVHVDIPPRQSNLNECSIAELPSEALYYLNPSRFCESDTIGIMVNNTFGHLAQGYSRVQAICDWIYENIVYQSGSSDSTTTARDVLVNRAGVCRDFAHLGISICRALNIPARFVFGYMPFYEANPDFHAIFEVYLENQWVLFDATRMGPIDQFVRVGVGLDAQDVPFATVYGDIELNAMCPAITLVEAADAAS